MKQNLLKFSFFLLGVFSVVSQSSLFRELVSVFFGNEFFSALILGFWLFWVTIGSLFLSKFFKEKKEILPIFFILISILLLFEIFFLRFFKFFSKIPGEIPNLTLALFLAFFATAPLCSLLGIFWKIASKIFAQTESPRSATNFAYFLEVLGFFVGGILFSFFLFWFSAFQVAIFLLILAFFFFSFWLKKPFKKILILALSFCLVFVFFLGSIFEKKTLSFQFKNQKILTFKNSPQGKIVLTKTGDQINFYESGSLLGSNKDFEFSKEIAHLALLSHKNPENVLLIGGGFRGILNEILKHPVKNVYYLELDPKIIEISKMILPEFKEILEKDKIQVFLSDPRYFLQKNNQKFDLILLNLPLPSSVLINRFFSKEFFELAKKNLKDDGIFFFTLPFSPSSPNKNLESLNSSILKSAKSVFENVFLLPGEMNFFFATKSKISFSPEILIQRQRERKIETEFLNEAYFNYRFYFSDIQKTLKNLEENLAKENKDFLPTACFFSTLFWLDSFSPKFSLIFKEFSFNFWKVLIFLIFLPLPFFLKKKENLFLFSAFLGGLSLMTLEMILIFAYQVLVGNLYFKIALILAFLMAGMAIGVIFGEKKENQKLVFSHFLIFLFCSILIFTISIFEKFSLLFREISIFILALISGFLGGQIFPLANKNYLFLQKDPKEKTEIVYCADLIGSFFGATISNLILILTFGIKFTLSFLLFFNLLALILHQKLNY